MGRTSMRVFSGLASLLSSVMKNLLAVVLQTVCVHHYVLNNENLLAIALQTMLIIDVFSDEKPVSH